MTHVENLIRAEELRQFRDGPAPITLATIDLCEDERTAIDDCPNAACRWSRRCNLLEDPRRC